MPRDSKTFPLPQAAQKSLLTPANRPCYNCAIEENAHPPDVRQYMRKMIPEMFNARRAKRGELTQDK